MKVLFGITVVVGVLIVGILIVKLFSKRELTAEEAEMGRCG